MGMSRGVSPGGRRVGLTIIELLVVIAILGMLVALLLPAVMRTRATGRKTTCASNMRNVGLAMLQVTEAQGRFPASGNFSVTGIDHYHGWPVDLLAGVERGDIADLWNKDKYYTDPDNWRLADTTVPVFVCPDDISVTDGHGNLSYVVNGGFGWTNPLPQPDCPSSYHVGDNPPAQPLDLNGNGIACPANEAADGSPRDKDLYLATGLFFIENWPRGTGTTRSHSLSTIVDGTTTTLMLSENVRAGYDPKDPGTSWACPQPRRNSFYLSSFVCEDRECSPGRVDYRRANDGSQAPFNREAINAALGQAEGEAPWPSSYHTGGVNTVFVDGHLQFLSENIEGSVYAALISPQGTTIQGPLAQPIVSEAEF